MRPTDPMRSSAPRDWRRRLTTAAIVGASTLYCLGIGAYGIKRVVVPDGRPAAPVAIGATETPGTPSSPGETLWPTQAPMVFPTMPPATAVPQPTATVAMPTPAETAEIPPTAVPAEPATATETPTETPTPTVEPTATETPLPTEMASPTPDHGADKPTETPTTTPE